MSDSTNNVDNSGDSYFHNPHSIPVAGDIPNEEPYKDSLLENVTKMLPLFLDTLSKVNRKEPSSLVLQGLTDFIGDTMVFMRGATPEEVERLKAQIAALRKMRNDFEDLIYEDAPVLRF